MKYGFDLDDTLADTASVINKYAIKFNKEYLNGNGDLQDINNSKSYYYFAEGLNWNKENIAKFFEIYYLDILKEVQIKPFVKETINKLKKEKNEVYDKIFFTLDEYITSILPKKMEKDPTKEIYVEIKDEYDKYKQYSNNRLDQTEMIEKNILLLGMSRRLFTHSLPLTVAEQCYVKLLNDTRDLIIDTRVIKKKEKAYNLLLNLIDEFNLKVLSTKVYWDKANEKNKFNKRSTRSINR